MIALEFLADSFHAHAGNFADDIHGHLPCGAHICVALFPADIRRQHIVSAGDLIQDLFDRDRDRLAVVQGILDGCGRHTDTGSNAFQHVIGIQFFHGAFQLADVLLQMVGDVLRNIVGQVQVEKFRLALDNGNAGLKIRRLDVGCQAPLEPGAQTLLQALDLLCRAIGRDNDLTTVVVQGVESVEKLFLRTFLAGQELDIVDQQYVRLAVLVPELFRGGRLDGGDDLIGEHFTVHIHNVEIRVILFDLHLDRVQQVGLAQAGRPVDEQRVVRAGRVGRNRLRRRIGKLVRWTLDEVFKGEIIPAAGQGFFVQLGFLLFSFLVAALFRGNEFQVNIKAKYRFEGILQRSCIAVRHNA